MNKFLYLLLDFMGLEGLTKEEAIDGLLKSLVFFGIAVALFTVVAVLEVMLCTEILVRGLP